VLSKLAGRGWTLVEPPLPTDPHSVVARYNGEPIKAGFKMEEEDNDGEHYSKHRSGEYNLEVKVDFDVGRGQVRVTEADGYENK
jgi:hypothetical protein